MATCARKPLARRPRGQALLSDPLDDRQGETAAVRPAMPVGSAGGLPARATLRLHLSIDGWCRNTQCGRGCGVSVLVGFADVCRDTAAGGHREAVGSCPLADRGGFLAIGRGTCGPGAPTTCRGRTPGAS